MSLKRRNKIIEQDLLKIKNVEKQRDEKINMMKERAKYKEIKQK